jgi:hypothetical protein
VIPQQQAYTNEYLFSALNPITGDNFHLFMPAMDADTMLIFLQKLKEQHPNEHIILV